VRPAVFDRGRLAQPKTYLLQTGAAIIIGVVAAFVFSALAGFLCFVSAWFAIGLTVGFGQTLTTDSRAKVNGPYEILRHEHRISDASALAVFPVLALGFTHTFGIKLGLILAAVYCLIVGETVASALWRRYLAMILPRPIWLPPFPRVFFTFARKAGRLPGRLA
jgi:hypothetical protein